VVKAALKYYCLADSNRSREPKNRTYKASPRQRFLGVPNSQTPNLLNPGSTRVAVPVPALDQLTYVSLASDEIIHEVASLTPHQRNVFGLFAKQYSIKQMARKLAVTERAVEFHCAALKDKIDFCCVASLT
jgi:hypothetical protein